MDKLRAKLHIRHELGRALIAEFVGTALLLIIGSAAVAQAVVNSNGKVLNDMLSVNVGYGLAIVFGVAVSAKLSGGHINPAVSLMFVTFGQLPFVRFLFYFLAQIAGAFIGSAITYATYHEAIRAHVKNWTVPGTAGIFASYPASHLGSFNGFIDQMVATAVFCFLIAHITDKKNAYPSWVQPILVGTSFIGIGVAFAANAGYPCNPARDFGPRLFTFLIGYGKEVFTYNGWFWIPVVAPLVGGVIGGFLYQVLIGFHTPQDVEEKYVVLTGNQELKPLTKEVDETATA